MTITLKPATVAYWLAILVAVIVTTGTAANYYIYQVAPHPEHPTAKVMRRLDLGHEPSIPAWYSSIALLASAVLLAVIALHVKRSGGSYFAHWTGLSVIFVLLAIDEAVMIHEMVDTFLHNTFETRGFYYFAWIIPGAIFAVSVAVVYLKFLLHLDKRPRYRFIFAGGLFVFGAVGMESVAGLIADSSLGLESVAHTISQAVEEGCEMFAIVFFIFALLDYIQDNIGEIRISADGGTSPSLDDRTIDNANTVDQSNPALSGEQT